MRLFRVVRRILLAMIGIIASSSFCFLLPEVTILLLGFLMINLFVSFGFLLTTSRVNGQVAFCNPVKVSLLAFFRI